MAARQFAVALEITPPRKPAARVLLRRARLLGDAVQAINVIQRPDRQSSLDASIALRAAGLHPVWHLVNRGRGRQELLADLRRAHAAGVNQILCLRGDHTSDDREDTPTLHQLVALARREMPTAAIGATLNQYTPDRGAVFRNLLPKLAAGATYVQTQPVIEFDQLRAAAEQLRSQSPSTFIVAMAMPLQDPDQAHRIEERLHIRLSPQVDTRLRAGPAAAHDLFAETLAKLVESDLVDGVAIMTFEMDPPPELALQVLAALRAAGALASDTTHG